MSRRLENTVLSGLGAEFEDIIRDFFNRLNAPDWQFPTLAAVKELEDELVKRALEITGGNVTHAALALGMNRTSLAERMARRKGIRQKIGTRYPVKVSKRCKACGGGVSMSRTTRRGAYKFSNKLCEHGDEKRKAD
jgi:DNA-binding protein Fis